MNRLREEAWLRGDGSREAGGLGEHVLGNVCPVHVEPVAEERHEQPPGTTAQIESRLTKSLDHRTVVRELVRPGLDELRPPAGHDAVVPRGGGGFGLSHHVILAPLDDVNAVDHPHMAYAVVTRRRRRIPVRGPRNRATRKAAVSTSTMSAALAVFVQ